MEEIKNERTNERTFKLILKPAYKDKDRVYLPEPIGANQNTEGRYFYNTNFNAIASTPSELTRYEFINLQSDFPEFMSYFDVKFDTDMILNANYPFSIEKDDGPYIVKIGQYYLSKSKDGIGSIDLILERDLRDAKHMSIDKAKFMANRYGGKVLKVSVELIEV